MLSLPRQASRVAATGLALALSIAPVTGAGAQDTAGTPATVSTEFAEISEQDVTALRQQAGGGPGSGDPAPLQWPEGVTPMVEPPMSPMTYGGVTSADNAVTDALVYLAAASAGNQTAGCTGTLISPDRVLTAAHCVWDRATGQFTANGVAAYFGGNLADPDTPAELATGVSINTEADLAVVTLRQPVTHTRPVPVWGGDAAYGPGVVAIASGYGNPTQDGNPMMVPGDAFFTIEHYGTYEMEGSQGFLPGYFGRPVVESGTRIIQGDSGGPLHNGEYIVGVSSASEVRAPYDAVFAPANIYAGWIEQYAPGSVHWPEGVEVAGQAIYDPSRDDARDPAPAPVPSGSSSSLSSVG